jgi:putative membrane protein
MSSTDTPSPGDQRTRVRGFGAEIAASSRSDQIIVGLILLFYLIILTVFIISCVEHRPDLQMQVAGLGVGSMYVLCIWHSVKMMGARPTIGFFVLAAIVTYFSEYMGDNHGWFFGIYKYTGGLGPRIGGVPPLIILCWGVVLYSGFMLIDWLLDLRGQRRGSTALGRIVWSALVAAATGMLLVAFDLLTDPMAVSGVWMKTVGTEPWWWWQGGAYLPELQVWQGSGGIPLTNFAGWFGVPFVIVFVFLLLFRRPTLGERRMVEIAPLLIYGYLYITMVAALITMSWVDAGLSQAAMIGTFTMGPVLVLGITKLVRDYSHPAPANPPS